jgi:hypothetical protein
VRGWIDEEIEKEEEEEEEEEEEAVGRRMKKGGHIMGKEGRSTCHLQVEKKKCEREEKRVPQAGKGAKQISGRATKESKRKTGKAS